MTKLKSMKAWAVITDGSFTFRGTFFQSDIFPTKKDARKYAKVQQENWDDDNEVIPVKITPIRSKNDKH